MNRLVNPEDLTPPIGFSHAVESTGGRTLYVAGQTGHHADGSIDSGLLEQYRKALASVARCMQEAEFGVETLVQMLIYTTDVEGYRQNLKPLGEAYREVFGRHYPAIALFGVTELFDPAAKIELVCTAVSEG